MQHIHFLVNNTLLEFPSKIIFLLTEKKHIRAYFIKSFPNLLT